MPAPVSQFAKDFRSGCYDRAKVLSDWAKLPDREFRKKYRVDPETAQKVLGNRPTGGRTFRARYGNDAKALADWHCMPVKFFEAKYGTTSQTAASVFGPRRPDNKTHGGARWSKRPEPKKDKPSWLDLQRAKHAREDAELARIRKEQEEAYGEPEYDLGNAVRGVGL